jgi:hypothetical protein
MSKAAARIEEMVHPLLERLGVRLPDAFLPDLALSLTNLSMMLASMTEID